MPFPTIVIEYVDGSQRTVSRDTLAQDWQALAEIGVHAVRFLPDETHQLYGDRFWAYVEGPNAFVVGARKPAQDVETPSEVPETYTEIVLDRQGRYTVRELTAIPPTAIVKRWVYG